MLRRERKLIFTQRKRLKMRKEEYVKQTEDKVDQLPI